MWYCLYSLIVLSSVIFVQGEKIAWQEGFWAVKECVYVLLGFTVIALSWILNDKKFRVFKNRWLGALLIFSIFSFGWYFYRPILFQNVDGKVLWNIWNFRPTLNIILALLLIQVLVEYTDNFKRWVIVAKILCWMGFLMSVYAILQWLGLDQVFRQRWEWEHVNNVVLRKTYMVTFFTNRILTANYISIVSPLFLMFKELRYKLMYLSVFLALIMSESTVSIIAFILGLIVYLLLSKKFKLLIGTVILSIGLVISLMQIYPNFLSLSGRMPLWEKSIQYILNQGSEFFGLGLGKYPLLFNLGAKVAFSAHNEVIQMFCEGGIVLLIIFLGYFFTLFRRVIYKVFTDNNMLLIGYTAAIVAYIITCLGIFPMRIAPLALIGILYISSLEVQTHGG